MLGKHKFLLCKDLFFFGKVWSTVVASASVTIGNSSFVWMEDVIIPFVQTWYLKDAL